MNLFDRNGKRYLARKVAKPRLSSHRGRTWDSESKTLDGAECQFRYDSTWGFRFYFQHGGSWYAMHFWKGHEDGRDATEIRDFYTVPPARVTI